MSDRDNLSDRIAQLRQILPELRARLEAAEEYRALRQLDERESKHNPLEAVDGVLLRGRLARRLEETNRYWRALVRIEAAIADLEGEDRDEALVPVGHSGTAAEPIGPQEMRRDAEQEAGADPEITRTPPPKPSGSTSAVTASVAPEAADFGAQVAPRTPAASQASSGRISGPMPAAATRTASSGASARRPDARGASVSVTSPVPTSLNLIAGDSSERHRTILDRIRPISSLAGPMGGGEAAAAPNRDVIWGRETPAPLPPAIDAPPGSATSDAKLNEDMEPLAALRIGAVARSRAASAIAETGDKHAPTDSVAVQPPVAARSRAAADPNRLDTLERELTRLIKDDGSTVGSPDAQGSEFGASHAPPERMASLESDVRDDLEPGPDVEEAEVTIVKLAEPAAESASLAGAERQARVEIRPAPRLAGRAARALRAESPVGANDEDADVADDGLAIEEAVVEIIVPRRSAGDGKDKV